MTVKVYGHSDDLIEVEGDLRAEFTAPYPAKPALLAFDDGTVLRIAYTNSGVWRIEIVASSPTNEIVHQHAAEDDDNNYSDVVAIVGPVRWVVLGTEIGKAA